MARQAVRVVRHGRERVLRVDDTFASSYEPGRVTTGSVWDALACGLLALPPRERRRVLLLGLGGGSAARVVRALAPEASIVGVELRPEVVEQARAHFDLDALGLEVRIGDARQVVHEVGRDFDLVLEDVFVGRGRHAYKPEGFPMPALADARRCLRRGGVLATNTLDEAPAIRRAVRQLFGSTIEVSLTDFDNRIYLASDRPLEARALRRAIAADPILQPTLPQLHLRTLQTHPGGEARNPKIA
ncbi:MAG: hypothetical protein CL910_17305 [Deltaproteobacteria bacterium]|nr:hypothetical protein [Deltaproteobacteria bacterium]